MTTYFFSRRGFEQYNDRISKLEEEIRGSLGDMSDFDGGDSWHDNFAYEEGQRITGMISRQLGKMYAVRRQAKVIDYTNGSDKVTIGSRVSLLLDDEQIRYDIVGYGESDVKRRMIAYDTPLAKGLIGRKAGERYTITIGTRKQEVEILGIEALE